MKSKSKTDMVISIPGDAIELAIAALAEKNIPAERVSFRPVYIFGTLAMMIMLAQGAALYWLSDRPPTTMVVMTDSADHFVQPAAPDAR